MKVVKARSNLKCNAEILEGRKCTIPITEGSLCIKVSFKTSNGQWSFYFAHPDCYIQQFAQRVNRKVRTSEAQQTQRITEPKKKRGRPIEPNTAKIRNLKNLLTYHKDLGHLDRVKALEEEIQKLVIGGING